MRRQGSKQKLTAEIVREYMPYGKVLIVDDMEPNLYVIDMLLSPYGLLITTATSGQQAIEKLKAVLFTILFLWTITCRKWMVQKRQK